MKPTIQLVAKKAGVSMSTVSRVMNNHPSVLPETRSRVLSVMKELDYTPNQLARGLSSNGFNNILIIFTRSSTQAADNPYFGNIIGSIGMVAEQNDYDMILHSNNDEDNEIEKAVSMINSKLIKGIVLLSSRTNSKFLEILAGTGIPIVVIGKHNPALQSEYIVSVDTDNYKDCYDIGDYLLQMGHTHIGCIHAPLNHYVAVDRVQGIKDCLNAHNIAPDEDCFVDGGDTVDDDELLCQSTVESLKSIGIVADWAMSGEDAVRKVEEHHNRDMDYQIILLDWRLPGMDGIETARAIRQHLGDEMPILLISAYDWGEIEERARKAGITGFISKPLFRSTLYYGLRKYMDAEEKQEDSAEQEINLAGKHILVAEDNELNWEIAEELLSELGLELDWADNGKVCVEKFEQSETGYYDAVLMDLRMPYMSGYEATEAIRKSERSDSQIPIIAMTADAFTEDIEKCLECGMNAHVAKPIDVKEIARLLEKYTR